MFRLTFGSNIGLNSLFNLDTTKKSCYASMREIFIRLFFEKPFSMEVVELSYPSVLLQRTMPITEMKFREFTTAKTMSRIMGNASVGRWLVYTVRHNVIGTPY